MTAIMVAGNHLEGYLVAGFPVLRKAKQNG